jgi:8-oxo-dGTP pyrophosphatase MutT (NUDIX family)
MTILTHDIPVRHRATAIIMNGDKFLLFHRIKPGHDYFIFPGGGVEQGETIEEALKREVKEELNISVGDFRQFFVVDNIYAPAWSTIHPGQKQVYHYFIIDNYSGTPELSGPEKAQMNDQNEYILAWLSLDDIRRLDNVVPKEGVVMFLKHYRKEPLKTLKFAPHLVPLVISGEKTSTWRLFDDKDLQKDDHLIFINKETGKEFAKSIITEVRETELGKVTEADYDGHEKFESKEKMFEAYRNYYGLKVTPDSILKIIKFELI